MSSQKLSKSFGSDALKNEVSTQKRPTKNLTMDQAIVKKFMNDRNYPDWFRGLSKFQMDAADSLLNNIRDDSEQGTSHRVRDTLIKLGINPLVGTSKIKLAMRLSRGNDIAFLWFLMELYYRRACDECKHSLDDYSVNEQLIFTIIAHLDTMPTLRELDKLLPKQPTQPRRKKRKPVKREKPNYVLPYFEKQRRPISYGKTLTLNEVDQSTIIDEYYKQQNLSYILPNEGNRWFAEYELNKSKRTAKNIIDEQIQGIFDREDAGSVKDEEQNPIYCAHHVTLEAMKKSMANELEVVRKQTCEKYFDLDGHLKDQSYKRVIDQLNKEIERAKEYFDDLTIRDSRQALNEKIAQRQDVDEEYFKKFDYGHADPLTVKNKYFKAPSGHKPYKFNYNKIFDLGPKNPIKDAIATALNADSSNISVNHTQAVKRCCKDIWKAEVEKYNAEFEQKEKDRKKQEPQLQESPLDFNLPYYDPRDAILMENMLIEAIKEMKKNKRFVLASLPQAYKMPILRRWIKKRYGMVYKMAERVKAYKQSKRVFQLLLKDEISAKIPQVHNLSSKGVVSYGCKQYLMRKANFLKRRYEHNFKISLLDAARMYWGVMRPYLCSKGPPRNVFFAYLPARENDVHLFRPWKRSEFMRAKDEWDRRQRKRRMDLVY